MQNKRIHEIFKLEYTTLEYTTLEYATLEYTTLLTPF
jgi:hypothetical protein